MRTNRTRDSLTFMLAAELTVAAQLLFFLPPPVRAAEPVTGPSAAAKAEATEAAWAALKIERSAPAPMQEVVVNKTVPNVEPPPQYPTFSPIPTDEELTWARVFGEPLIPEAGESNDQENQALAQAITTYLHGGDSEALEPIEGVVTAYPNSRWRVAVQANVGSWYRRKGYFTRAQRNLSEAWRLGKDSDTDGVRRLAEFAAGDLMQIYMQFGQVDPLEALTAEFAGRELVGSVVEKLDAAHATVWGLRNEHGKAIPSGSVALERVRKNKHHRAEREKKQQNPNYKEKKFQRHSQLDSFPATPDGASIAEIHGLAGLTDLKLQMARRVDSDIPIPMPAVYHLKAGHFGTVVEERNGKYRLDDPLLGGELWISQEAFNEETSGYFLLEQGRLPAGWRGVNRGEAEQIRGKCVYAIGELGGTKQNDVCKPCKGPGVAMARYAFHLLRASLSVYDSPVGYSPPVGPAVRFRATYNQREANQPTTFYYSNLGVRWVHDWMSYIEDDPAAIGEPIELFVRGGGSEPYQGFVNNVSSPQQDSRAVMTIASTSPIKYERELTDGSIEVFGLSDGAATAPRRVFLTELKDPQGNKLTFTYDSELRLVSVTDAIDQVTTLAYGLSSDPLKITKVTDPFGRSATLDYDDEGQLIRITDVIGLTSEFEYGVNVEYSTSTADFVRAMKTPYGTTTFRTGIGPYSGFVNNRWVEATDPLGGTERVEHILSGTNPLASSDPANTVPTGFSGNSGLNTHVSIYYSKLAMDRAVAEPPDPTTGEIFRFRSSGQFKVSAYQIQSRKLPLESRVWYEHAGETALNGVGPAGRPAMVGRVLDDGSSQISRYEYNTRGLRTRVVDPIGRETIYEYASNQLDLQAVRQKNGSAYDRIEARTFNSSHLPLTVTNAAGQTTVYTYSATGSLKSVTSPERAGVSESRTTTYDYDADGYLETKNGATGATTSYTYDSYGRVRTSTDIDGHVLTFDYDALDRQTKLTYPNSSFDETVYERLDAVASRDRLGRWTRRIYDARGGLTTTIDPLGRTSYQNWCTCGTVDSVTDGNGQVTSWERDLQLRTTKETRADGSEWLYEYEDTTSRIQSMTDPKEQVQTYTYSLADNLLSITYTNEEHSTPNVVYTYDPVFDRLTSMVDGTGTTTYSYHAIGASPGLGATQLATIDGPFGSDTISYSYDELNRAVIRSIDGVAMTREFDVLGRVSTESNVLGSFSYQYDGYSGRVTKATYPNGQTTSYSYFPSSGDNRLKEIHHQLSDGTTLSRFEYTHDAVGNILSWTQQQDAGQANVYDFGYDTGDQLRTAAWRTTGGAPSTLKRYGYVYDAAGNITVRRVDDAPTLLAYDTVNRISSQTPGGELRFAGTLDEAAVVTIQGSQASVAADNSFVGSVVTVSGSNQVLVKAKDYSGNERTNAYSVNVSGSTKSFTFDANGNLTGDGTRTYEWDAEDRLVAVVSGSDRSEFTYNGNSLLVRIVEKESGIVVSDRHFLWCELELCEERDSSGALVLKRFFLDGVQDGADKFYVTDDHLGSIREMTDVSEVVRARYDYDPSGERTYVSGDETLNLGFGGHMVHATSGLVLAPFRTYDPTLGRWLNEDPAGFVDGYNLYAFVRNNPTSRFDEYGLQSSKSYSQVRRERRKKRRDDIKNRKRRAAQVRSCVADLILPCVKARPCIGLAYDATDNRYYPGASAQDDGEENAHLHCVVSCCMAQRTGRNAARRRGDAHENFPGNDPCQREQDMNNNDMGATAGAANPSLSCDDPCSKLPLQTAPKPAGTCKPRPCLPYS